MNAEHRSGTAGARWILAAALVMLAAGSFYFWGYQPEVEKIASLKSNHEEKRLFLQKTRAIVEAKRAELAAESTSADTMEREAAVPGESDREGILLDLEQAAKSAGVQIQEVVFEAPGIGALSEASAETLPTDSLSTLDENLSAGVDLLSALSTSINGSPAAMGELGLLQEVDLTAAGFSSLSLRLTLRGTLAEVKSFAAVVQSAKRLYVVQSFEYGKEEALVSETAAFRLVAFYRE